VYNKLSETIFSFSYIRNMSGYFLLTNRKCPDNILSFGTFPIAQQEISRHAKSVGTFSIGVVGTLLVGCVGISTASVSGHFYRPKKCRQPPPQKGRPQNQ
jgi:hypothetical protein